MFFVYVIKSESGKMYIGQTKDLEKRLIDHNSGNSFYTRRCRNWKLIYSEKVDSRAEAMTREKELKTGKGRDFIKKITV